MSTTISTDHDGTLCLGGTLGIYDIEELCQAMLAHLRQHSELRIDLGDIGECDAAGAQLLCSARLSATNTGKPCTFRRVSPAITACFAALGLPADHLSTT